MWIWKSIWLAPTTAVVSDVDITVQSMNVAAICNIAVDEHGLRTRWVPCTAVTSKDVHPFPLKITKNSPDIFIQFPLTVTGLFKDQHDNFDYATPNAIRLWLKHMWTKDWEVFFVCANGFCYYRSLRCFFLECHKHLQVSANQAFVTIHNISWKGWPTDDVKKQKGRVGRASIPGDLRGSAGIPTRWRGCKARSSCWECGMKLGTVQNSLTA